MIDKTVKLVGEYPSDFKPTLSIKEIQRHFEAFEFYNARMIGGSKVSYSTKHPDDLTVFNANILTSEHGKVWHGDLNLTEDYLVLKEIAKTLNTDLYILWESDARFGEEKKPLEELLGKAVWNTSLEEQPTKKWYRDTMIMKRPLQEHRDELKNIIRDNKKDTL
jgi:hypothetical protein